jgi:hypothetical protein
VVKLEPQNLPGVVRDLDDSPHLVRWILESRDANRVVLEHCDDDDEYKRLQGENRILNSLLDKVPKD